MQRLLTYDRKELDLRGITGSGKEDQPVKITGVTLSRSGGKEEEQPGPEWRAAADIAARWSAAPNKKRGGA